MSSPTRPRRTQADRRATTRAALLDATIDALVEQGYANLTTNDVARRAGVTRGAHAHHFTSKADLMVQALERLTDKMTAELEARAPASPSGEPVSAAALLDLLWQVHCGPLFTAATELWNAARTDPELRAHLRVFDRELMATVNVKLARFAPELVVAPHFGDLLVTAMATMRGLAMLRFTASGSGIDRAWAAARRELLRAVARTTDDASA